MHKYKKIGKTLNEVIKLKKKSPKFYLYQAVCAMAIIVFCLGGYLLTNSILVAEEKLNQNHTYVSYEILTDNVIPVIKEEDNIILKPFKAEGVNIVKNYYDYKSESDSQESSIVYYENTYIQNTGVDYSKESSFEVVSILSGTVISITEDDIVGKTIKIKHDNDIISTYQSLGEVTVEENETVNRGQIIATSGENSINSEIGNHLHFELSISNKLVDPEQYYGKKVGEF